MVRTCHAIFFSIMKVSLKDKDKPQNGNIEDIPISLLNRKYIFILMVSKLKSEAISHLLPSSVTLNDL